MFKVMVTNTYGSQTVKTLAQAGITQVNLNTDATDIRFDGGSVTTGQSAFVKNGVVQTAGAVTLSAGADGNKIVTTVDDDTTTYMTKDADGHALSAQTSEVQSLGTIDRAGFTATTVNRDDDNGAGSFDRAQVTTDELLRVLGANYSAAELKSSNAGKRSSSRDPNFLLGFAKWRRLLKAILAIALPFILCFGPVRAEESRECSDLVVSESLINRIQEKLEASGWPNQKVVASLVSMEGITIEIEASRSLIETRRESRTNASILGLPARISTNLDLDGSLRVSTLFFAINGMTGHDVGGYIVGDAVGPDGVIVRSSSGADDSSENEGILALIYYSRGPLKSREFDLKADCREYIFSDALATVGKSRIFDLLIAIIKRDAEND